MHTLHESKTGTKLQAFAQDHWMAAAGLGLVLLFAGWFALLDRKGAATPDAESQIGHFYPLVSTKAHEATLNKAKGQLRTRRTGTVKTAPAGPLTDARNTPAFVTLMGLGLNPRYFYPSDTQKGHTFYGGRWAAENITHSSSGTALAITKQDDPKSPYAMAEFRTNKTYGYGRYEVVMQPAPGSGLVSAFFTYTGPYAGDPHDEIDIEFLGKDTTKVHFNYFRNGRKGNFATFDLPFDAAEAPHLYAFEWTPEGITWFVDGTPYYRTSPGDERLPKFPGRIYMSTWTGTPPMQQWHGKPTFTSGAATKVSCISFQPMGYSTRSCADVYSPARAYSH